jgi:uncharacterized protein YbjT (DUF2867 family)
MYVITGVTGNTGGVVARTLLDAGQKVRVVVRSPEKGAAWRAAGAEVAVASLEDPIALAQAFEGAVGAYLLIPPDATHPAVLARGRRITEVFVEALTRTPVPHVVLLSSIGAQLPDGTGPIRALAYAEPRLRSLPGVKLTALRAAYFMENFGSGLVPAKTQGVLPALFDPSRVIEMVSTVDIGRVAALALREPPATHQVIELAGPTPYSTDDAARALAARLGREVTPHRVPNAAIVATLTGFGMSTDVAELYREMCAALDQDALTFEGGHRLVRGQVTLAERLGQLLGG